MSAQSHTIIDGKVHLYRRYRDQNEKFAPIGIAPPTATSYNLPDNSVGILSRVAEGLGPSKPQQPVFLIEDAGATSYPASVGRDKIVCSARLLLFTHRRRPNAVVAVVLFWTIRTSNQPAAQARVCVKHAPGGIVRVRFLRPRPQVPTL